MPTGTTFGNDFLKLIIQATAIANIADNAASSPLTNLYWSLHTADPSGGNQSTSEIAYTTYARVAKARTSGGHTVTGLVVQPVTDVVFPTPTAGSGTATYAAIGTAASGTGKILWSGPITPSITITVGTPPTVTSASTLTISP
jgi:hypothetical protein